MQPKQPAVVKNSLIYCTIFFALLLCSASIYAQTPNNTKPIDKHDSVMQVRDSFIKYWTQTCFPNRNWDSTIFVTLGLGYPSFTQRDSTANALMSKMYVPDSLAIKFLPGVIISGSNCPKIFTADSGQIFYKIVRRGGNINSPSPYYICDSMFKAILTNPCQLEQQLGLPIGSLSVQYDVFTIQ